MYTSYISSVISSITIDIVPIPIIQQLQAETSACYTSGIRLVTSIT